MLDPRGLRKLSRYEVGLRNGKPTAHLTELSWNLGNRTHVITDH